MTNSIITILVIAAVIVVLYILFKIFKLITRLLLIAIFLIIAYLTNPGIEKHTLAVKTKAEKNNVKFHNKNVTVSDFKIFSLTKVTSDDHERLVGVGLFTRVWIFRTLE
jgi:hypothetical protein